MKSLLIITLTYVCVTFHANAQITQDRSFIIHGTIAGIDSGIIRMLANGMDVKDSAVILKGKFVFRGKLNLPERKSFVIMPGNWAFKGFVDDSAITFNIDTAVATHQYTYISLIWQIKETGSPMANVYRDYENKSGMTDCLILVKKLKTAKKDSLGRMNNKVDSLSKLVPAKQKLWIENYIHQNPSSLAGIYIFNEYYNSSSDRSPVYLSSILNQFSGAAKMSKYYEALTKKLSILTKMQVSKLAPNFTLPKKDNYKFTLSTTRGSVAMLDFWASWCVPCRAGIPHWKKVYAKYHGKNFNIVSISDDRFRNDWVRVLDQEKMPWTQVIDEFPSKASSAIVGDLYGVKALPFFVLLNEKGEVIVASSDEEIMTKKIDEIFK